MDIDIKLIKPSPYQPRLFFDVGDLKEEIERDGLLSDLVVRKRGKVYELIDGERRLRALKELGWKSAPTRVIKLQDNIVRRSVYKVNKIRENYTVEEEARYFKKLTDEGVTPWEISKELSVDFHWVMAHLNIFKFSNDVQKALWTGQISISHLVALESVINRSLAEAATAIKEIINRKLTINETKKIIQKQKAKVEEMRIEAAQQVLSKAVTEVSELKTVKDFQIAARTLKKMAKKKAEKELSAKEKAAVEAKRKERIEKQKLARKERERRRQAQIKAEAEKLVQQFKTKESQRIAKRIRNEIETTSIAKLKDNVKKLTLKIKKLQNEKASFLQNKAFLLEALNFNCPHCQHACVVYRDGTRYLVKRSASVVSVPEKPGVQSMPPRLTPEKKN